MHAHDVGGILNRTSLVVHEVEEELFLAIVQLHVTSVLTLHRHVVVCLRANDVSSSASDGIEVGARRSLRLGILMVDVRGDLIEPYVRALIRNIVKFVGVFDEDGRTIFFASPLSFAGFI